MEELTKMHVDWKKTAVVVALVILTGLTVGGTTWYFAEAGAQDELEAYKNEIATLETRIAQLEAEEAPVVEATTKELTDAQIYTEVEAQLKLVRANLSYFRIYSQDKVTYSTGQGITYAYKEAGTWKVAQESAQAVAQCSALTAVPEAFRPPCFDSTTNANKYVNADSTSLNYTSATMRSYIGE
jgi:hypothetical protein